MQQSQPKGFDWFGAIFAALKSSILSLMPLSAITVSLFRYTGHGVEVLLALPGGLRFIVGYGIRGPYLKPWSSLAADFETESSSEDEIAEGSNGVLSKKLGLNWIG